MVDSEAAEEPPPPPAVRSSPGMRAVHECAWPCREVELLLPMLPVRPEVAVAGVAVVLRVVEVVLRERGSSKVLRSAGKKGGGLVS